MHSSTIFKLSGTQKGQAWKFVDADTYFQRNNADLLCFTESQCHLLPTYCFIMQNITPQSDIVSVGNVQADWEKNCMLSDINTVMTKMSEKIQ